MSEEKIPSGIHFDMAENIYHAFPALGSGALKSLANDPYEFQFDRLYGEDKDTEALKFGQAVHARVLESRESFLAKFCQKMPADLIPHGALDTVADLKRFLAEHGQSKFSSKTKPELIRACLDIDPSVAIVAVIEERWKEQNAEKTELSSRRWAQVELAAQWAQRDPLLKDVMEDGTFSHGAPEVSIFYEDRGVNLKARFDRLLRHAIVDVKTFAPMFDGPIETSFLKTIDRLRYDLQCAAYIRAWHRAKILFAEGKVFGAEPFPGFLKECFDRPEPKWFWVMVKSKGAPQPLVVDWKADFAKKAAAEKVERAIEDYIRLRDEFGDESDWVPSRGAVTIEDIDLPAFFGRN